MAKFKINDFVRIKGNAKGTVWEFGVIEYIEDDRAFIGHTTNQNTPENMRLRGHPDIYGKGHPLEDLVLIAEPLGGKMEKQKTIKIEYLLAGWNPQVWEGTIEEAIQVALGEIHEHAGGSSPAYVFTSRVFDELGKK